MEWKRILVPTDFSDDATVALEWALDLAQEIGASVTLLHAYHVVIPLAVPPSGGGFRIPGAIAREMRSRAEGEVARAASEHARPGVRLEGRAVEEPASFAIVREAGRLPADLIVMGTRGRSGLTHAVLGSVAERVMATAPCPVVTVRAAEA
jgi:nucleotide-binding universal stress UspA family protein